MTAPQTHSGAPELGSLTRAHLRNRRHSGLLRRTVAAPRQAILRPSGDRLWLVGDLVNRGPDSLAVLRFVRSLGAAATVVLGNHDLYLLMLAAGFRKRGKDDTLEPVLKAPDREELLDWLALRKLFHAEGASPWCMRDSFPNGASHRRSCSPLRSSRPCVGPGGRRSRAPSRQRAPRVARRSARAGAPAADRQCDDADALLLTHGRLEFATRGRSRARQRGSCPGLRYLGDAA